MSPRSFILILVLVIAVLAMPANPALAQSSTPLPDPSPAPTEGSELDKPPPWDPVGRAEFAINSWFRGLVASALDPVFKLLGKTILATPRLDLHPRIRELWRFSLGVANAALVLFVLAGSGIVMVGGLSSQLTVKELLPRVLGAAVAVNLALPLAGQLIALANALTLALLGTAANPDDVSLGLTELVFGAGVQGSPLFILLALAVLILAVLVIVAFVIRVAALVVLLAGGPLLLVTHALPQTDHVARAWWRLTLAMIAAPVFQALVLTAATKVFLTGGVLGLGSGGGLIDLLVIGCLLYVLYRIPLWTMHLALRGAGSRAWAVAKEKTVVVVRSMVSGGAG